MTEQFKPISVFLQATLAACLLMHIGDRQQLEDAMRFLIMLQSVVTQVEERKLDRRTKD